jgi:hypothetical protein
LGSRPSPPPPPPPPPPPNAPGRYLNKPLTTFEAAAFARDVLAPRGYLCVGLELYVTHEPCLMCSMALLHSRFDRIVFARRMPRTGGLTAETLLRPSPPNVGRGGRGIGVAASIINGDCSSGGSSGSSSGDAEEEEKENGDAVGEGRGEAEAEEGNGGAKGRGRGGEEEEEGAGTGAGGRGYGLFWRPELNWKFLAWEWCDADPAGLCQDDDRWNA